MTPDEFRTAGHDVIEWIATYMETVDQYPVLSTVEPGEVRAALPEHPPAEGEPFERLLADVDRVIMPGITHWQSPSFFAYFPANASGPSILGELLSAGLGVQGMLWATSPACTELETLMCDWMLDAAGLPDRFRSDGLGGGVIQDSASSATLCALLAAREAAVRGGAQLTDLRLYATAHSHSSAQKAARIAGLADEQLVLVDVDARHAMHPDDLAARLDADLAADHTPFFVFATTGTTSSTALDPIEAIADVVATIDPKSRPWLHVDGAFAGSAAVCPEFRFVNAGLDRADSYCFNPHKWLLTNFDCSLFWVADRTRLLDALSILPEYLRNEATEAGTVLDYRDWQVPLGRRFRALKLWFVVRSFGTDGLREHIRRHCDLATTFAAWVEASDDFEVVTPTPLSLVCFRHTGGDATNEAILDACNASGDLYLTHTKLNGRFVLRLAIGAIGTELRHVEAAWAALQTAAATVDVA